MQLEYYAPSGLPIVANAEAIFADRKKEIVEGSNGEGSLGFLSELLGTVLPDDFMFRSESDDPENDPPFAEVLHFRRSEEELDLHTYVRSADPREVAEAATEFGLLLAIVATAMRFWPGRLTVASPAPGDVSAPLARVSVSDRLFGCGAATLREVQWGDLEFDYIEKAASVG